MIRAGLLALVLAGPAAADSCAAAWARAAELLPIRGSASAGQDDWCVIVAPVIDMPGAYVPDWHADRLLVKGPALDWIVDGTTLPERLEIEVEGLRLVVQTGDAQMDWLFAAQARANPIRVEAALDWSPADRTLALERLEIDFPGDNRLTLSARAVGVDLSSRGAMQMSATGFAVTEAELLMQSHGLFEWYALMALGPALLPREGDMDAAMAALQTELIEGIAALPGASLDAGSKAALAALVAELPNPAGTLTLAMRSEAGLGPARLMGYAVTGMPDSVAGAGPLFDGVRVDIGWEHEALR